MNVFVVLGQYGEYSDREVFVGGVFTTKEEAQTAVCEAATRRGVYDSWYRSFLRELDKIRCPRFTITDLEQQTARELAGPEPEYESAEHATIIEVETGTWNSNGFKEAQ
jgi:hypothetical protein